MIRHLASADLSRVQRGLPPDHPEAHVRRLSDQRAARTDYLIAWDGSRPVGHVVVRWGGPTNPDLLWLLGPQDRSPYIEALLVHEAYRSLGIGSALLDEVERLVAARGFAQVGLAVAVDNWRARALYRRRGYRQSGLGTFSSGWSFVNERGEEVAQEETCMYLTRTLAPHARPANVIEMGRER